MSRKQKRQAARELAAAVARPPAPERFTIHVVDDFGTRRTLTKAADCDCFEGSFDTADGPMPYTLPAGVVAQWRRVAP